MLQRVVSTLATAFSKEFTMAGYRPGAPASSKGVHVGLARHAVEEMMALPRSELATLEAVHAMMCQDAEPADDREERPAGDEDTSPPREDPPEDSAIDKDPSADEPCPAPDTPTLGPPRNGSMRDAILTLLCTAQEAMSITYLAEPSNGSVATRASGPVKRVRRTPRLKPARAPTRPSSIDLVRLSLRHASDPPLPRPAP